ncbi:hypothetical protein BKA25_002122 [Actinoalloteichus hymeniacidonis]|nr:hypothetical protein [Actinoalloteichus hymeniacidonis]
MSDTPGVNLGEPRRVARRLPSLSNLEHRDTGPGGETHRRTTPAEAPRTNHFHERAQRSIRSEHVR